MKALLVKYNSGTDQEVLTEFDVMHYSSAFATARNWLENQEKLDSYNKNSHYYSRRINHTTYSNCESKREILHNLNLLEIDGFDISIYFRAIITISITYSCWMDTYYIAVLDNYDVDERIEIVKEQISNKNKSNKFQVLQEISKLGLSKVETTKITPYITVELVGDCNSGDVVTTKTYIELSEENREQLNKLKELLSLLFEYNQELLSEYCISDYYCGRRKYLKEIIDNPCIQIPFNGNVHCHTLNEINVYYTNENSETIKLHYDSVF